MKSANKVFEKMVEKYFPDSTNYEESSESRTVFFRLEDSSMQDEPEFEPLLLELAHILEPETITHQIHKRDNGGCGDPECCGYNYTYNDIHVRFTGVRFSEEHSENPSVEIKKLPDQDPY